MPAYRRLVLADIAALVLLGALVVALHPGLALGGVLADLDAFGYFLPYREAAARALREGRLPLWNPLIFGGVPFLANIQTAVFYPATWLGVLLDTPRAVALTLLLHFWVAAAGMYWLGRVTLQIGRLPAWLGAAVLCLSGTLAAHAGHLNQMSAAAWLPWLVLLYDRARTRRSLPLATLGAFAFALQLLAGHPQVSYLSGVALGALAAWRALRDLTPLLPQQLQASSGSVQESGGARAARQAELARGLRRAGFATARVTAAALSLGVLFYMAGLGAALAAVQLLPTAELSARSIRAGGMTMEQAASFSLPPWELLRGLFPAYDAYPFGEYIAYLGVAPLALAVVAVRLRWTHVWVLPLAVLAGGALVLALGQYLPVYWAAYYALPGAGLFRVPARWLLLWTFAGAALAAIGLHLLITTTAIRPSAAPGGAQGSRLPVPSWRPHAWSGMDAGLGNVIVARWRPLLALAVLLLLIALSAWQGTLPSLVAVTAWLVAGGLTAGTVWLAFQYSRNDARTVRKGRPVLALAVVAVALTELAAARQGLTLLTAYPPELATGVRPALLAVLELGGDGRVLSLVDTRFEPGDAAAVRARLIPPLTLEQTATFLGFAKLKEAAAPNTGMLSGVASLDGYDGGLLPLRAFDGLKRLLIESAARRTPPHLERRPPQPDGLLRLEVPGVPDAGLLAAVGVRGIVMDRLHDAWVDGSYYDLALVSTLEPRATLRLAHLPETQATAVGLVTYLEGAAGVADGTPVADVRLYDGDGGITRATLRAGHDTAEGRYAAGRPAHGQARVAAAWRAGGGQSYHARAPLTAPRYVQRVEIESLLDRGRVALHGVTLLDERLNASEPVVLDPALGLTYLGDLKVYENLAWLGGVWAAFGAVAVPPGNAAAMPGVLPNNVILARNPDGAAESLVRPLAEAGQGGTPPAALRTTRVSPEHVSVEAVLPKPAFVVFPEAAYPGWTATVDGQVSELVPANVLFQAVYVPEGRHRIEFRFAPPSLQSGWVVTRGALAWSALVFAGWGLWRVWRRLRRGVATLPMTGTLY